MYGYIPLQQVQSTIPPKYNSKADNIILHSIPKRQNLALMDIELTCLTYLRSHSILESTSCLFCGRTFGLPTCGSLLPVTYLARSSLWPGWVTIIPQDGGSIIVVIVPWVVAEEAGARDKAGAQWLIFEGAWTVCWVVCVSK